MRRSHRKSRYGCHECKKRHIKCDEGRPSCANCSSAQTRCSFLNSLVSLPVVPPSAAVAIVPLPSSGRQYPSPVPPIITSRSSSSSRTSLTQSAPTAVAQQHATADNTAVVAAAAHPLGSEAHHDDPQPALDGWQHPPAAPSPSAADLEEHRYNLLHMSLLHHYNTTFAKSKGTFQPEVCRQMHQLYLTEAFATPYLMDELLSLSAAHKSITCPAPEEKAHYLVESTRLQTRSLARFNAAHDGGLASISADNCVRIFIFSTLLGHHMLFETFAVHRRQGSGSVDTNVFSLVLDKFVQCLGLHRGISIIAGVSWPSLGRQMKARFGSEDDLARANLQVWMAAKVWEDGEAAAEVMQDMFDSLKAGMVISRDGTSVYREARNIVLLIQEWPVRLPAGYIDLLHQRWPEALVILAYYAVLLHRARSYWAAGDAGAFLIRSITAHLGGYWAEWLRWPNHVLETETGDGHRRGP
ncbi:hypothetical protein B0T17DRAFT_619213 [Bombardia bombarda]|uniref:Zn(2)-C6 fungal-type domain-containing protein n=1 Tax=Bombardia bombarda TaxID=252184 RepID=A0AA40BVS9_9PEZI|nr:hypothetical protein B0T17DRAFT_619213 [Bombardia bombarda]